VAHVDRGHRKPLETPPTTPRPSPTLRAAKKALVSGATCHSSFSGRPRLARAVFWYGTPASPWAAFVPSTCTIKDGRTWDRADGVSGERVHASTGKATARAWKGPYRGTLSKGPLGLSGPLAIAWCVCVCVCVCMEGSVCTSGMPLPMMVLAMMMEGLPFLVVLALAMAASMALKSWPSIVTVFQLGERSRSEGEEGGGGGEGLGWVRVGAR